MPSDNVVHTSTIDNAGTITQTGTVNPAVLGVENEITTIENDFEEGAEKGLAKVAELQQSLVDFLHWMFPSHNVPGVPSVPAAAKVDPSLPVNAAPVIPAPPLFGTGAPKADPAPAD